MAREQAYAEDDEPLVPMPGQVEAATAQSPRDGSRAHAAPDIPTLARTETKAQLSLYETLGKSELLTSGPTRAILTVWRLLDADDSGSLCKAEFDQCNKQLAVKWNGEKAWNDAVSLQTMQDLDQRFQWSIRGAESETEPVALASEKQEQEISFRVFVSVYNQIMGHARRHARRDIKIAFESWMNDPRGLLPSELDKMIKRVEKILFLLAPRYNMDEDLKLLAELSEIKDMTDTTFIDFTQFERWWKYRVGLLEADTPVIPEL
jgi:hypothetical protein